MRRNFLIFTLFSIIALSIFAIYFATQLGDLDFVMPLDDVYIHFQYARQLANGQPYSYNIGEPATSGATSFIYPYVLAVGYIAGFQGLNLGIWAMLVGMFALIGAMGAIHRLCSIWNAPLWLAVATPILFAVTGSVSWHAMSGMETMLIVCLTLWTLLTYIEKRLDLFFIFAVLLALTRPEGSIMAIIATTMFVIRLVFDQSVTFRFKHGILLLLPIVAVSVQPSLNFVLTGSFSASGSQAKSLLGLIPQDWNVITSRILENIIRLWVELFTGYSVAQDLWYLIPLTVPIGVMGWILLLRQQQYRGVALLILLWLLTISFAISTLDTAFWHFKRYQMPLMALFVPLAVIPLIWLFKHFPKPKWLIASLIGLLAPLFAFSTFNPFLDAYRLNVNYIRYQPYAMAKWLTDNTPEDALIAVHDVGMMRYVGERNTLDMVGLTTPDAAQYWRNGVGSVTEFLMEHKPDYIASYGRGHGYGLYMLADTRAYSEPLAEFTVNLDSQKNVALAADTQAIYKPDWDTILPKNQTDAVLFDVNVANIDSEETANYKWLDEIPYDGFATVVYDFDVLGCDTSRSQSCNIIEGARQLTGAEQFAVDLSRQVKSDYVILKSRVHPVDAISFDILVSDQLVDTQWIPDNPGHWLDIETRIPVDILYNDTTIEIVPKLEDGELYVPARHTIIQAESIIAKPPKQILASYQHGHLRLSNYQIDMTNTELTLTINWHSDGQATGDYRFFAHLYDDINQPPPVQWDNYLGHSTLPLGNWLPGIRQDTINLNIESLDKGEYQLMIGFYDSMTYDRLSPLPTDEHITAYPDGRLALQSVEIK